MFDFYKKALIPVFADIRYQLAAAQRWVPYLQCSMGYSFVPEKDVNGGYFFKPTINSKKSSVTTQFQLNWGFYFKRIPLECTKRQ